MQLVNLRMPVGIIIAITFGLGAGLGLFIGWLWGRSKAGAETELRRQLAQRDTELAQLHDQLTEANAARAAAEAKHAAAQQLLDEAKRTRDQALSELRDAFKALSVDTLRELQPQFVERVTEALAKFHEAAKGDLAQRQEAIKGLLEPLKQQLEVYQKRLDATVNAQATALGEVKKQLETLAQQSQLLAQETQQFRMVLRSDRARGRWGEETLRRIVEVAGMSAHCDFSEQTQSGDAKPDLIVHLPGDRVIIVDAKVPELDFLSALDTADPSERAKALAAHAAKLKNTIKALADRDYPSQFPNALDYVVLFLPAESLFSAALEGDRDLIVWAASKKIILATPASLIAILRSVSVSWQQHAQTENARKIAEAAQELYKRVVTFFEHFERIGDGLKKATEAFDGAARSYQARVRPAGERLAELGGGTPGKTLPDTQPLEPPLQLTGQD